MSLKTRKRRVAIPPKNQHHLATGQQPHVSADAQRVGRCHQNAEKAHQCPCVTQVHLKLPAQPP